MIYFDVSTLNPEKVTGVGVYMLQLLKGLHNKNIPVQPVVKLSRWKKRKHLQEVLPQKKCGLLWPWSFFSSQDLYHGPDFKLATRGAFPRIVTVHDMVVFEQKYNTSEFYEKGIQDLTRVLKAKNLDAVIVNSQFTKSEVLKHFPYLADRLHVTYLGCDRQAAVSIGPELNLPEKYILFLGTLEKRKNVCGVIEAFQLFKGKGFPHKLILAGGTGFGFDEIQRTIEACAFKNDIVRLNYVSDAQIQELYRKAEMFFFPSFYEGFGIPVLEAMAAGCPVVTSSGGALDEITGGAALKASAYHPEALATHLMEIADNPSLRELLKEKGISQAAHFTWEKCLEETLAVYEKVLRKN